MIIKINSPVYDVSSGLCSIKLSLSATKVSTVVIDFKKLLPHANSVSKETLDFFILSAAVYGIDRFIKRKIYSVDGWSREIDVQFPVENVNKWQPTTNSLNSLLSFLTGDYWNISFYQSTFIIPPQLAIKHDKQFTQVSLFSGGLDSLIGAIDFLKANPTYKGLFVSHYDHQMGGPRGDQLGLTKVLVANFPNFTYFPSINVSLEKSTILKETTFRSRSILFIGIATLLAESNRINRIIVPENGSVSLNFPLSTSRRSACSTRTTHPTVLNHIRYIWDILGIKITIANPYELQTKGEMVNNCRDHVLLQKLLKISNSCGKRGHRAHWNIKDATHCGVCMPCVYRRAALTDFKDTTTYGNDINSFSSFLSKKSQDVGACLEYLKIPLTNQEIKNELIVNGVKDLALLPNYTQVVDRTRKELKNWFKKFGNQNIKNKGGI